MTLAFALPLGVGGIFDHLGSFHRIGSIAGHLPWWGWALLGVAVVALLLLRARRPRG